jgi:hypothetical protein
MPAETRPKNECCLRIKGVRSIWHDRVASKAARDLNGTMHTSYLLRLALGNFFPLIYENICAT